MAEEAFREDTQAAEGRRATSLPVIRVADVQQALQERAGIRLETVSGRVDWSTVLTSAVPFQPRAAIDLAAGLRTESMLRATVAGVSVVFNNARDWGEREFVREIAANGYGEADAISTIDLTPFAGGHALPLLLTPIGGNDVSEGSSLLARLIGKRHSGVLVFEHFDRADQAVQSFLLEGATTGRVTDFRGRELWLRTFTCVFLQGEAAQRRMGFGQLKSDVPRSGVGPATAVSVILDRPDPGAAVSAIADPVLSELSEVLGVSLRLDGDLRRVTNTLPVASGLEHARARLRAILTPALAEWLDAQAEPPAAPLLLFVTEHGIEIRRTNGRKRTPHVPPGPRGPVAIGQTRPAPSNPRP